MLCPASHSTYLNEMAAAISLATNLSTYDQLELFETANDCELLCEVMVPSFQPIRIELPVAERKTQAHIPGLHLGDVAFGPRHPLTQQIAAERP